MESSPDGDLERKLLYQVNHVFLPPQVPQEDDTDLILENALVSEVLYSLSAFGESLGDARPTAIDTCLGMLRQMLNLRMPWNELHLDKLEREIHQLKSAGMCYPAVVPPAGR